MASREVEVMYAYECTAAFVALQHRPCHFRTSDCPDLCGHATDVLAVKLIHVNAVKNEHSKHVQWVTPVEAGEDHFVDLKGLSADLLKVARELKDGDKIAINWEHQYVTNIEESGGRASGPEYHVTHLSRA